MKNKLLNYLLVFLLVFNFIFFTFSNVAFAVSDDELITFTDRNGDTRTMLDVRLYYPNIDFSHGFAVKYYGRRVETLFILEDEGYFYYSPTRIYCSTKMTYIHFDTSYNVDEIIYNWTGMLGAKSEIIYYSVVCYDNDKTTVLYEPMDNFFYEGSSGSSTGGSGDSTGDTSQEGSSENVGITNESLSDILHNSISGVTDRLNNIFGALNPLSEDFFGKELFENIGKILDYLNPFSDNFFGKQFIELIGTIISYLNPFNENFLGYKIVELFSDLLQALFVPSNERFEAIGNTVKEKFAFIDTLQIGVDGLQNSLNNLGNSPSLSYEVESKYYNGTVKTIDLSWYADYKNYIDFVITGFVYLFFLWRLFVHAPNIINGIAGNSDVVPTSVRRGR